MTTYLLLLLPMCCAPVFKHAAFFVCLAAGRPSLTRLGLAAAAALVAPAPTKLKDGTVSTAKSGCLLAPSAALPSRPLQGLGSEQAVAELSAFAALISPPTCFVLLAALKREATGSTVAASLANAEVNKCRFANRNLSYHIYAWAAKRPTPQNKISVPFSSSLIILL